ncbi:MAG: hypothetical protein ACPGYT_14525 [Nitrospirales bacterium]
MILSQFQNGYGKGVLIKSNIDHTSGAVIGHFSNGQVRVLAQLKPTIFDVPTPNKPKGRSHNHHRKRHHDNKQANPDTVQAKQSGVWTVGQLGTWHVKIDSSSNEPMAVMDMTKSKQSPWAKTTEFQIPDGQIRANPLSLTTPGNQRLVIKHISFESTAHVQIHERRDPKMTAAIQVMLNDQPVMHHIGVSDTLVTRWQGKERVKHVLSKPFQIYVDPGSEIKLEIERSYFNTMQNGMISLSGYLEPVF